MASEEVLKQKTKQYMYVFASDIKGFLLEDLARVDILQLIVFPFDTPKDIFRKT